jgi:hypothetical protein
VGEVYNLIGTLYSLFKRLSVLSESFVKFNTSVSKVPLQGIDALSVAVVIQKSHFRVLACGCEAPNDALGNIVCTVYDN